MKNTIKFMLFLTLTVLALFCIPNFTNAASTETATDDDREYLDRIWADYGWGANIDWRDDPQSIKWSKFLSDTRYNDENLGIYEGAFLVGHGLYRATEQSMMNKNDTPFNAPSREAIYKRIMQYSEGDDWQYDYEEFVNFDKSHEIIYNTLPMRIKPANGAPVEDTNTGQPIMKIGSWKDFYSDK